MKPSIQAVTTRFAASALLFLCVALPAGAQTYNYDATILSNQPAVYYEMQESAGAGSAVDSSGNGHDAAIDYDFGYSQTNDFPLLGLPGVDTNAYLFHTYTDINIESHVSDVDGYNPNPQGPFSIEFWARVTSDANNYLVPVGAVSGSYPQPGWDFYQTPGAPGYWVFNVPTAGAFIETSQIVKNQWTHLVGVYDGTHLIFYVNGVATATVTGTGFTAGTGDLFIGDCPPSGWGAFDGYLTQVAFYTNALSAAQVLNDYTVGSHSFATNGEPPLVLADAGATNTDPQSIAIDGGATATFDPIVIGSTPLSYQWYSNGVAVAGATSSLLSFTAAPSANDSTYYVIVTNNFGSTTSQVATLTVYSALVINSAPMSISRYAGSYAAFHVTASGTSPINYQWSVSTDGGNTFHAIAGATNQTYWLSNVQLSQNGNQYSVLVTGPGVSSNPSPATLNVSARPVNVPLTGYGAIVAADNPVGFWELNEPSGSSTAIDAVGSFDGNYELAVTNGITDTSSILFGEAGGVPDDANTAVSLVSPTAGVGGTIQVPWAPELNPDTPWSVETWVQPASLGANGNDYRVVLSSEYNEYPNPYNGWYMYQQPNGSFAFVPQPGNGFLTAGSITPGNWYYLVITDDGTNFNFYINGVLAVAPVSVAGADFIPNGDGINPDGSAGIGGADGGSFVMGQRTDGAFNTYQGGMEDTAIYNYALTPKQIMTHFVNQINLTITKSGNNVIINWPVGTGTLEESAHVNGPYTTMGVAPPYTTSMSGTMFYRLLRQ